MIKGGGGTATRHEQGITTTLYAGINCNKSSNLFLTGPTVTTFRPLLLYVELVLLNNTIVVPKIL